MAAEDLKNDLNAKLKYLGFDLDNIPECLYEFNPVEFNASRLHNDKDHRVFKFVPIDKIEILLTPTLRSDPVREKYGKAAPLSAYLSAGNSEESLEKYTTFLHMLANFSIADIENVSTLQKQMQKTEPFKVRYNKEHLWQIYYSEPQDRYFMLVCTKESTFAEFFYLLKRKIEIAKSKKSPLIFVPINYLGYSERFLNKDEIVDAENYLWLFTKEWPSIYEVYDKENKGSLQIIGDTYVFESIKSTYKIVLKSSESAVKFYKLLKALFIMQTEIKDEFKFETKINSKNELEFYYGDIKVSYDSLTGFIKDRYDEAVGKIEDKNREIKYLTERLEDLNRKSNDLETEYIQKQREIGAYLECKKTFMGKVKYFFKSSKISKKIKLEVQKERYNVKEETFIDKDKINLEPIKTYMANKKYYTIEDLVVIYGTLEKTNKKHQNLSNDNKAMELKLENLRRKVQNAELYIEEIDSHKKSIFEFWKFTSKDELAALEEGFPDEENAENNIRKSFDIESDFEALGVEMDKLQRKKLSREEQESVFVASGSILDIINNLKKDEMNESLIRTTLYELKEEFEKSGKIFSEESFDIFGNIAEDSRKSKYLGSRSHRESERNKYRILNINRKIDEFDFTEKLQMVRSYIEGAMPKITSKFDMPLYMLKEIPDVIDENCFAIMDIDPEKELETYEDKGEGALNLIKLNIKEGTPLLYHTNIIYYDNTNQTLPEGMDLSRKVLIDCSKLDIKLVNQTKFRTNNYFRDSLNLISPKSKDIFVYEYEAEIKK